MAPPPPGGPPPPSPTDYKSSRNARASSFPCFPHSRKQTQASPQRASSQPRETANMANDPFMTRGGKNSSHVPGYDAVNVRDNPFHGNGAREKKMNPATDPFGLGGVAIQPNRFEYKTGWEKLQITVCYVTNLDATTGWGFEAQSSKPYVTCMVKDIGNHHPIGKPIQAIQASAKKKAAPSYTPHVAQNALPTTFDYTYVVDVTKTVYLEFCVQQDGMFQKGRVLGGPFPFEIGKRLVGNPQFAWDKAETAVLDKTGENVEINVQMVRVKDPIQAWRFDSAIEDRSHPQPLRAIAVLQEPVGEGQMYLDVALPRDLEKRLGLKAGESIFIAPEVPGKKEIARVLELVHNDKTKKCHMRLDTRLRHSHGVGTTVAIRYVSFTAVGGGCCLHVWENAKICFNGCSNGAHICCLVECWVCCFCCHEVKRLFGMCFNWCVGRNSLRDLRRQCAQRCKLPYDPAIADDDDKETALCCIPLRTAVFILSVFSLVVALKDFIAPGSAEGLALSSHVVSGVVELAGLIFGFLGAVGACQLQVNLLNMYNCFQMARLCAKLFMMYTDAPILMDCDLWRTDVVAAAQKHSWIPEMYDIAMNNRCTHTQIEFLAWNVFCFWLYIYLISLTRKLIWDCEATPKYLLSMPREAPSGVFIAYSRTDGKRRPPYGAIDGTEFFDSEAQSVVGPPVGVVHRPSGIN